MSSVTVLSFGSGVQSTCMILLAEEGKIPRPDFAVFADTKAETARVYEWLARVEEKVSIPIVKKSKGDIVKDLLEGPRFVTPPFFLLGEDGKKKGMARRQCTQEYKIEVIQKAIRERLGYRPRQRMRHAVTMQIGISTDEATRMKPAREKWSTHTYPLIDLGMSRQDCIEYVRSTGLGTPPRSSCYMCPFHNDGEWLRLKNDEPEYWQKAVEFDARLRKDAACKRGLRSQIFLHSARVPLSEVALKPDQQINLFENECEGMCGV